MEFFLEPYAGGLDLSLLLLSFICMLIYLALKLHLITRVTPRIDRINGYQTTHQFKINLHQNSLYRRCVLGSNQSHQSLFIIGNKDLWLFRAEQTLARSILLLFPLGCSIFTYTHTLLL